MVTLVEHGFSFARILLQLTLTVLRLTLLVTERLFQTTQLVQKIILSNLAIPQFLC